MTGIPRWVMLLLAAALVLFGIAASLGWIRDPSLAKADYVGTIDVCPTTPGSTAPCRSSGR